MGHPSQSGEEAQWGNVGPTQSSGCLKKGTLPETTLLRELTFSHLENGMVGIRVRFLLGQKADFFRSENLHLKKDGILKGKYVFFSQPSILQVRAVSFMEGK